ncbi:hypothetical protein PI125_g4008 [Phytophthora idaei]|nr:hypothetical protein PI125_g4008 [Phytophthora idaei]KAG3166140.1 hypothetical protein PI126_g4331 [Phytophthora idaei]
MQKLLDSTRRGVNDDMKFEALVVASIVLASRHGGVHGVGLVSFLGVLLYEVGVISEREDLWIPLDLANTTSSKAIIPFLLPPKLTWPEWFLRDWEGTSANFANLVYAADSKNIDFRVSSGALSGECWIEFDLSKLDQVVGSITIKSALHLIFTETSGRAERSMACYHISKWSGLKVLNTRSSSDSESASSDVGMLVIVIELSASSSWRSWLPWA